MVRRLLTVALILLGTTSAVWAENDEAEIRKQSEIWEEALVARDGAKIASLYTVDAMLLPPNSEFVRGREAITELWTGFVAAVGGGSLEIHEVRVDGDLAYVVGSYEVVDGEGAPIDRGKYIEIWTRRDGQWALHRDIWNTSLPEPASK